MLVGFTFVGCSPDSISEFETEQESIFQRESDSTLPTKEVIEQDDKLLERKPPQLYCNVVSSFEEGATIWVNEFGQYYYSGAAGSMTQISEELMMEACGATNYLGKRKSGFDKTLQFINEHNPNSISREPGGTMTWTVGNCTYQSTYNSIDDSYSAPELINSVCSLSGYDPINGESYHPHYTTHNCSCN